MQAVALDAAPSAAPHSEPVRLRGVVLTRVACAPKGIARQVLLDDLAAMAPARVAAAHWRQRLEAVLAELGRDNLLGEVAHKLQCTEAGRTAAAQFLGLKGALPHTWTEARDTKLVARALGIERESAKRLKALAKPEGLRAAVLQRAYALKIRGVATPSRLRAALAAVALARAFGNRAREGFGGKLGLSAKAGRLLAGQLAAKPRDFNTDARLVAALAAESVGAVKPDFAALQSGVLRRFLEADLDAEARVPARPAPAPAPRLQPSLDAPPRVPLAPAAGLRPDLAGFGKAVRDLAVKDAQGWSGNRKAYISHIWRRMREEHAGWGLSEIEFKCMLAEAHRAGHLALANADLKDAKSLKDVQESALVYKNAVFHFVRVEA